MNNIIFKTTFLKGEDGNNILRIDKTATSGLVDTYTITLTDGTTTTFNVTNGSSIATIEKTATVGMVDTYTITLTDGSTSTFEVTNGANVTIDDHLDANSTNPVQNKVVNSAITNANNYDNTTSGLTANTKQGAIDELALDLNGFKFYPAGTDLVALVADDSYYTDSNGNYVLADSTTGESLIDNVTYKSLASVEDLRGKVGADTASPFKVKYTESNPRINITSGRASNTNGGNSNYGSFGCYVSLLSTDKKVKYTCNTPWGETSRYLDGVRTYIGNGNKSGTIDLSNNTSFGLDGWGYSTNWSCSWSIKVW